RGRRARPDPPRQPVARRHRGGGPARGGQDPSRSLGRCPPRGPRRGGLDRGGVRRARRDHALRTRRGPASQDRAARVTADERIVSWLRKASGPLSGEEIARRLGCSRAAVWKRIAALRELGYGIDGRRPGGYALRAVPDRLGPAELAPHLRGSWRRVEWHEETDSTQRVGRDLARAGAPEGTIVIAERPPAGR